MQSPERRKRLFFLHTGTAASIAKIGQHCLSDPARSGNNTQYHAGSVTESGFFGKRQNVNP